MSKQKDFNSFLNNIEPSSSTKTYISKIQTNLRNYLKNHEKYKNIHIDTFLSGSYAKSTSIRPVEGEDKRDVDIIVVTNYSFYKNSTEVLKELKNILLEKDIYKTAKIQKHSIGIEMGKISVDVVPVIVDEEDDELYYIGDNDQGNWSITDPKGHKTWSTNINKENNNEFKPLVKIFKWWRRNNCIDGIKYPKGITLEKIVADNLGDSNLLTEEFLISTIQNIVSVYKEDYVDKGLNPIIDDPSNKIFANDLLSGYTTDDFAGFICKLEEHMLLLNEEGTTNDTWRKILGNEFPKDTNTKCLNNKNYEICISALHRQKPIWPIRRGGGVLVSINVINHNGDKIEYANNDNPLDKGCKLYFHPYTGVKPPFSVMWQIVNTGYEARNAGCLRGNFEYPNYGKIGRVEYTEYSESHSVQCFILKKGVCVAISKEFIINIR